jgi:hypothetical protein
LLNIGEPIVRHALLALPLALVAGTAAHASSDAAWARFNLDVAQHCAAASGLNHAHISTIVGFDDSLGKVAALVTGIEPQRALHGAQGKRLCIYDKRSKRVWIDEAKGWSAPDLR